MIRRARAPLALVLFLLALVLLGGACAAQTCSSVFGDTVTNQIHRIVGLVIPPAIGDPICDADTSKSPSTSWGPPDGIDEGTQVETCFAGQPCTTIKVCAPLNGDTPCNACAKTSCCSEIASAYVAAQNCAAAGDDACDEATTKTAYASLVTCVSSKCTTCPMPETVP